MALKAILESKDQIPAEFADFYKETEAGFVLDVEGVDDHPSVKTLKNAFERTKTERADYLGKVKDFTEKFGSLPDDFDPAEYTRLKTEADERAASGDDDDKDKDKDKREHEQNRLARQIEGLKTTQVNELAERDKVIVGLQGDLDTLVIGSGLDTALAEAGVEADLLAGAKALLRTQFEIKRTDEGAMVKGEYDQYEPLAAFVKTWVETDQGRSYVARPKGSGASGGQGGGDAVNPWKEGATFNVTQQGQVFKEDRAKARRMMEAAGRSKSEIRRLFGE